MSRRQERYVHFENFRVSAEDHFNHLASIGTQHEKFKKIYGFIVSPGGAGGVHTDRVDVFYGARPFADKKVQAVDGRGELLPRFNRQFLTERGASLNYQRMDNGRIIVTLAPAATNSLRTIEREILVGWMIEPRRLAPDDTLTTTHFDWLVSYMEVTSLDGEPGWLDHFLVWKLRVFHPVRRAKQYSKSVVWKVFVEIMKFTLTVGLSGFLLYAIQRWMLPPSSQK